MPSSQITQSSELGLQDGSSRRGRTSKDGTQRFLASLRLRHSGISPKMATWQIADFARLTRRWIQDNHSVLYQAGTVVHGQWTSQDCVVYVVPAALLFIVTARWLAGDHMSLWRSLLCAGLIATTAGLSLPTVPAALGSGSNLFAGATSVWPFVCCIITTICLLALRDLSNQRATRNTTALLPQNGQHGFSKATPPPESAQKDETDVSTGADAWDDPKEIARLKALRRKRWDGAGSWSDYLKDFKVLLPILKSQGTEYLRCGGPICLLLLLKRFLNVLEPRQRGIVADVLVKAADDESKIASVSRAVAIWGLLSYLRSSVGADIIATYFEDLLERQASGEIRKRMFRHMMQLDDKFRNDKTSAELNRAFDRGHTLYNIFDTVLFRLLPALVDIVSGFFWFSTWVDPMMGWIFTVCVALYLWLNARTDSWTQKTRARRNEALRHEDSVVAEAINNFDTIQLFNRASHESDRHARASDKLRKCSDDYSWAIIVCTGLQELICSSPTQPRLSFSYTGSRMEMRPSATSSHSKHTGVASGVRSSK